MAGRPRSRSNKEDQPTGLRVAAETARSFVTERIEAATALLSQTTLPVMGGVLEQFLSDFENWASTTRDLLGRIFDSDEYANGFASARRYRILSPYTTANQRFNMAHEALRQQHRYLKEVLNKIDLIERLGPVIQPASLDNPGAPTTEAVGRESLPSGTLTLMMTDIEHSTAMWDTQPDAMRTAVARHNEIVHDATESNGGAILKRRAKGDDVFAAFTRASAALTAADAVHKALSAEPWPEGLEVQVRIGIHTGEVESQDSDYLGPVPNLCKRLQEIGGGGDTIVSETTRALVEGALPKDCVLRPLRPRTLKGVAQKQRPFQLVCGLQGALPRTATARRANQRPRARTAAAVTEPAPHVVREERQRAGRQSAGSDEVMLINVGPEAAIDCIYLSWNGLQWRRSRSWTLADRNPQVAEAPIWDGMWPPDGTAGALQDGVAEVIVCSDRFGSVHRFLPRSPAPPEKWRDGVEPKPDWVTWYLDIGRK